MDWGRASFWLLHAHRDCTISMSMQQAKGATPPATQTAEFNNCLYASNGITKIPAGRAGVRTLENLYAISSRIELTHGKQAWG